MQIIKKIVKKILMMTIGYDLYEKKIFLVGNKLAFIQKKIKKIKNLKEVEFSVFSQWGDDGIINWLIQNIPIKNKVFLEIGTEDYIESNTRFLLKYRNWNGYIIEGNKDHVKNIKKQTVHWKYDLNVCQKFITKENINNTIKSLNLKSEIGLLSLDIDGIDYWIWKELKVIKPIIFVCEFNSVFGDLNHITVPYKKDFNRTKFHYSNLIYGASLKAFISISNKKGYKFVGTNSNGVNAYFVKKNYYKYIKNKITKIKSYISKHRESRDKNYKKNFIRNLERYEKIKKVDLVDLNRNKKIKLNNYNKIYSTSWERQLNN